MSALDAVLGMPLVEMLIVSGMLSCWSAAAETAHSCYALRQLT